MHEIPRDDQVVRAEEALRRAEVGEKRGRKRTSQIDVGLLTKHEREHGFTLLSNRMKKLAVSNAVMFEPVLEIFKSACDEAEKLIRRKKEKPTSKKRLAEETQKSSQPQLIDDDTSDEAEVAGEENVRPMKNPPTDTAGSGRTKKARISSRGK
jgi:hypothetical protein